MRNFLQACSLSLDANRKLCSSDAERDFQRNMDFQFDEMKTAIDSLIQENVNNSNAKKNKKVKKGILKGVRFGD
jgi:hypothetical protein